MLGDRPVKFNLFSFQVVVIVGLSVELVKTSFDTRCLRDNDVLRNYNALQEQVIAILAFNFNRFNQFAEHANRFNCLIDTSTKETVIE